jgi:hypothetical protein
VANISVDKSTDINVLTEKVNQSSQQSAIGAANTSGMMHNLISVNLSRTLTTKSQLSLTSHNQQVKYKSNVSLSD